MRLDLFLSVSSDSKLEVMNQTVVVIDVLRTGSSIVQAMANGAQEIYPVGSTGEALKLASSLGRDDSVLCGSSRYSTADGFDIGNSPTEFISEKIAEKRLVMTTTNGTPVFDFVDDSFSALICCFLNLGAIVQEVSGSKSLTVVCAGSEGNASLEDTVCAGILLERLSEEYEVDLVLNDAGKLARVLGPYFEVNKEFLAGTERGKKLREEGFEDDLDLCSQLDVYSVVPEMREKIVRLMEKDSHGSD